MKKYIRVYRAIIAMNISYFATYRANLIAQLAVTVGWTIFQLIWIFLLTNRVTSSYGWSRDELTLFTLGFLFVTGFFHMFFSHNFEDMANIVNKGELDGYLLRPVDSAFLLTTLRIRISNFARIIIGGGLITWWVAAHHIEISMGSIVTFSLLMVAGVTLLYAIWMLFCTFLIWYPNLNNLPDFLFSFNNLMRYPTEMFQNAHNIILTFFLPLMLIVTTPIRFLINKPSYPNAILLILFSIVLFVASRIFWQFALRSYTSVG